MPQHTTAPSPYERCQLSNGLLPLLLGVCSVVVPQPGHEDFEDFGLGLHHEVALEQVLHHGQGDQLQLLNVVRLAQPLEVADLRGWGRCGRVGLRGGEVWLDWVNWWEKV
jgi:hypothetical protein